MILFHRVNLAVIKDCTRLWNGIVASVFRDRIDKLIKSICITFYIDACDRFDSVSKDGNSRDTHTAIWDWGDNKVSVGVVIEEDSVKGAHTYSLPGVYTVTLTVIDDSGGQG